TIATGSQTFTTQSGLGFASGQPITVVNTANSANYMQGAVTSYSGTTLVINVASIGGSGTYTAWTIVGDFQVTPTVPFPSANTLGGVESLAASPHQWINAISTLG